MIRWIFKEKGLAGERPHYDRKARKVLRRAFSGADGEEALAIILSDLGFFDEARGPSGELLTGEAAIRANALRDYARRLLEMMGVLHEGNALEITKNFMALPAWEPRSGGGRDGTDG